MGKYNKPPLDVGKQIELLKSRGLIIQDIDLAKHHFQHISYYRLSAYMLPFKKQQDVFKQDTSFQDILDVYFFDKKLRMITFDAIEKIEVSLRAFITYVMSMEYGANWFEKGNLFEKEDKHKKIIETIKANTIASNQKDVFIEHYCEKYTVPALPPSWMVMETLSFGNVSFIFSSLKKTERKKFEKYFKYNEFLLKSWFHALTYTRNLCCHHSRLWNREFIISPKVNKNFGNNMKLSRRKFFAQALVIEALLKTIAPTNHWSKNLKDIFNKYPNINIQNMGFPKDFKSFYV
jgi:abortive infection bacteriophage resistance protein